MKHTLFNMHVLDALKRIPDGSVDCVFTSPPYYGLRLYSGAGVVWDGDAGCQHEWLTKNVGLFHKNRNNVSGTQEEAHEATPITFIRKFDSIEAGTCTRCGAWKGQLGLEPDYKLFVSHLLQITAELKRVLKPTGTLFWNMGDSYAGDMGKRSGWNDNKMTKSKEEALVDGTAFFLKADYGGIQRKSLMMIPERFAMRMVDEQQWTLRNKIIWRKPNGIPSSVKDRFSNKWEYVFFFSRNAKYYFNLDGVRVPLAASTLKEIAEGYRGKSVKDYGSAKAQNASETKKRIIASYRSRNSPTGANPGDILETSLQPHPFAHFAVFPSAIPEFCIMAGCPQNGVVLDPFAGSGTTGVVAWRMGLSSVMIEVSEEYCDLIRKRMGWGQQALDSVRWVDLTGDDGNES